MEVNQDWVDQQRAICEAATPGPWRWDHLGNLRSESKKSNVVDSNDFIRCSYADMDFIAASRTVLHVALDALEAERAEKAQLLEKIDQLTAERDAVPEIDLRDIRPGYMGVCMTDEEDGIQIRKTSNKHPQGRGFLADGEEVQDVVVIRFTEALQVMAVADRLLLLAETMAGKIRPFSENAPTPADIEAAREGGG